MVMGQHHGGKPACGLKQKPHRSISIGSFYFWTFLVIACNLKRSACIVIIQTLFSLSNIWSGCRVAQASAVVLLLNGSCGAEWVVGSELRLLRLDCFWLTSRSLLSKMSVFDCGARFHLFCDPDGCICIFFFFNFKSPLWLAHSLCSIACHNLAYC